MSFSFILLIETCIRIGLIPSNDNYLTYSKISSMPFVITDKKLNPVTNHLDDIDITKAQYEESMTKGSLLLSKNIRLSNQNISGGHIFYIEDLSSIIEMVHELSSKNELLSEEKELIAYENELKEQKAKIEKKNQLYDNIFAIVKEDLNQLKELLEKTDKESENCLKNRRKHASISLISREEAIWKSFIINMSSSTFRKLSYPSMNPSSILTNVVSWLPLSIMEKENITEISAFSFMNSLNTISKQLLIHFMN